MPEGITGLKKIHMVGIKGAGMAALAIILKKHGITVCGSDVSERFFTDTLLEKEHISIERFSHHDMSSGVDAIIYSTAYPSDHPERIAAETYSIPSYSYPEALAFLFNTSYGIAVSGSHGKTTTSGMLAYVFFKLGVDPTALVGSEIRQLGTNALVGSSDYFILEADEYQNKFLLYSPKSAIVTNIDYDHPDFFKTPKEYFQAFASFIENMKEGTVVVNWDDPQIQDIIATRPPTHVLTYGSQAGCDYRIRDCTIRDGVTKFSIDIKNNATVDFSLRLIGCHNAYNAAAVFALCHTSFPERVSDIKKAICEFEGTKRRFEMMGQIGATLLIDDYGHHPTEIKETLKAARQRFGAKKIWCVFGPHTFSRTEALFHEFITSFDVVDMVLVLDIYTDAREKCGDRNTHDLVRGMEAEGIHAQYVGSIDQAVNIVKSHLSEIDILITIGAGDVWRVGEKVLHP